MHKYLFTLTILCVLSGKAQTASGPYAINWRRDGAIAGTALVSAFTASSIDKALPVMTVNEIQALSRNSVNPIDRLTAGWYSRREDKLSDVLVGISILSPLTLLADGNIRSHTSTVSVMYLETITFATFLPSFGKGTTRRVRPFVYGMRAPVSEKQNIEALRSFFSGHATWAFSTSIFFANVYSDFHPDSPYRSTVWYGSVALASSVALLRVSSGSHFLSDIAVGAAVGTAIGLTIPALHRVSNAPDAAYSFLPDIGPDRIGAQFTLHLK